MAKKKVFKRVEVAVPVKTFIDLKRVSELAGVPASVVALVILALEFHRTARRKS